MITGASKSSTPIPAGTETPAAAPRRGTRPRERCVHCGLPLTSDQRAGDEPFCCAGCELVYGLIHDQGLDRFYELKEGVTTAPPMNGRPDGFAWLDRMLATHSAVEGKPRTLSLDVQGVRCAACVWLLQTLFRREPGAVDVRINPALGKADLTWIEGRFDIRHYLEDAQAFGYRFGPSTKATAPRARDLVVRMGICIAVAMNAMIFSLCFYLGLAPTDGAFYGFVGALNAGLATISVATGGWVFVREAVAALKRRVTHLDLPIALGICLAYAGSMAVYLKHGPEAAYFDTVTIFVALMLVGRWLQERVLERNRTALLADGGEMDIFARRVRNGVLEAVPISAISPGDEIRVVPGDLVPLRSSVLGQAASVSLDWITGESDPVHVSPGDEVPAGAFNAGGRSLRLTALEPFEASRLQGLLERPTDAVRPGSRAAAHFWSRVSRAYVFAVLSLATLGFAVWAGRDLSRALEVTVTILVITCPCALGIAVPLGRELVQNALRRRGVFLRSPDALERAFLVRHVLFDKTGTVTLGRLRLTRAGAGALEALDGNTRRVLHMMVSQSNHPISRALAAVLGRDATHAAPALTAPEEIPGKGLSLSAEGKTYRLGQPAFAAPGAATGTGTVLSVDGHVVARFDFEEEIRPDAVNEVERLGDDGYDVHLLSGDREERVAHAAVRLGIPERRTHAGLSPEDKARLVRELDEDDTLMVGDGINDALGFDAALCSATPAIDRATLPGRADFYFLGDGMAAVRLALVSARRLRGVTRDNLIFAVVYNAGALTLCFAGLVTPVIAAVLMPASSIAVVSLTTWRLSGRRLAWMS